METSGSEIQIPPKGLAHALRLVRGVCDAAGDRDQIDNERVELARAGVIEAIQRHDSAVLFDWLVGVISYQGVSDAVAENYLAVHGSVTTAQINKALRSAPSCPRLKSYWHFESCGYRKTLGTCNSPRHIRHCPLPKHDLRNGSLNQAAYSLYLFIRDIADGDLVSWIDQRLATASRDVRKGDRTRRLCNAILAPMRNIHGVADKVLSMTLASLLIAGDAERPIWVKAGAGMIAVDTLVHAWLHRTGILRRCGFEHPYGQQCYGSRGCAVLIESLSRQIDARIYNRRFPKVFPRFVQKAIWRFCAQAMFNQCNGNRVDDRKHCKQQQCELYRWCDRVVLNPTVAHTA